jgi:hypothetical protein
MGAVSITHYDCTLMYVIPCTGMLCEQAAFNTALFYVPYATIARGYRRNLSTLTWFLNIGFSGAAIWCASDLAQSGIFSWLAEDSSSILTQTAAQYAHVCALVTDVLVVTGLQKACILRPLNIFYLAFTTTGSTFFSKRVYHILE